MNSSTLPDAPAPPASTRERDLAPVHAQLQHQRRRARTGIWIEALGLVALLLVAYALPTLLTDRSLRLEWIYRALLLGSFLVVAVRVVLRRLLRPLEVPLTEEELALAVERGEPALRQSLISSLQFERDLASGATAVESPALKAAVVAQLRQRLAAVPFGRAIDARRVRRFAGGVVAAAAFFGAWGAIDGESLRIWAQRNVALSNVDWPRYTVLAFADGVDAVRLPQGDALTVRVEVAAGGPVPDQVFVEYAFADGEAGAEPMSLTGEREFSWTLDTVLADLRLTVQGGDSLPIGLGVTVVERPRIDDLSVRVTFPDYMEREPFDVPPTEGELRLPRGAALQLSAKSQKPLTAAFLLFGSEAKVPLALGTDGHSFRGEFAPPASGLLVVDVIDADRLGAGTPPKLLLRVGDDKPPTLEFRLRGIGTSITAHARIPGELKVRDDFGLRSVDAVQRAVDDRAPAAGAAETAPAEVPWAPAEPVFAATLGRGAVRYETQAIVDLARWNKVPDEQSPENPIRPGMLFSLRFGAKDNFGPGDPHEGFGETMTFRVVTRDKLVEELRRRQVEQRQELQTIAEDEHAAALELAETVNPREAGELQKQAEGRFRALARRQQALGRRVRFVGDLYQRILWEYENNRLIEANKVRQIEALITAPLESLATDAFPATSRLVEVFLQSGQETTRAEAVNGYKEIERRLAAVLKEMEQAENLAALLEELRNVIKLENDAIRDVQKRVQDREQDLFRPKKDAGPGGDPPKGSTPDETSPPKVKKQ